MAQSRAAAQPRARGWLQVFQWAVLLATVAAADLPLSAAGQPQVVRLRRLRPSAHLASLQRLSSAHSSKGARCLNPPSSTGPTAAGATRTHPEDDSARPAAGRAPLRGQGLWAMLTNGLCTAQEESKSQQLFYQAQQDKQSADPNPGDRQPKVVVFPVSFKVQCHRKMISPGRAAASRRPSAAHPRPSCNAGFRRARQRQQRRRASRIAGLLRTSASHLSRAERLVPSLCIIYRSSTATQAANPTRRH